MTHFQLFAWFGKILLVKKILGTSKFLLGIPLDPNSISNDQVGSGPGPDEKILGASKSTVSTEQIMSRKTDFQ